MKHMHLVLTDYSARRPCWRGVAAPSCRLAQRPMVVRLRSERSPNYPKLRIHSYPVNPILTRSPAVAKESWSYCVTACACLKKLFSTQNADCSICNTALSLFTSWSPVKSHARTRFCMYIK